MAAGDLLLATPTLAYCSIEISRHHRLRYADSFSLTPRQTAATRSRHGQPAHALPPGNRAPRQ